MSLPVARTDKHEYLLEVPGCRHCIVNYDMKGCISFIKTYSIN